MCSLSNANIKFFVNRCVVIFLLCYNYSDCKKTFLDFNNNITVNTVTLNINIMRRKLLIAALCGASMGAYAITSPVASNTTITEPILLRDCLP